MIYLGRFFPYRTMACKRPPNSRNQMAGEPIVGHPLPSCEHIWFGKPRVLGVPYPILALGELDPTDQYSQFLQPYSFLSCNHWTTHLIGQCYNMMVGNFFIAIWRDNKPDPMIGSRGIRLPLGIRPSSSENFCSSPWSFQIVQIHVILFPAPIIRLNVFNLFVCHFYFTTVYCFLWQAP